MTPAPIFLASPGLSAYVLDVGVSYRTEVNVAALIVTINGEPLSLEGMFGDMLTMLLDLTSLSGV